MQDQPKVGMIIPVMGRTTTPTSDSTDSIGSALFGVTRQAVLRLLFGHVEKRFYQQQIIRSLRLGSGTVQRELEELVRAGILARTVEGRQTYFQANSDCPVFAELRGLVRKTFGVAEVLEQALLPLARKVRLAFIYGSIATGEERAGSDIDVMVVGDEISMLDVATALHEAQDELGREVNPTVYHTDEFCRKLAQGHHFLKSVIERPVIFLIGDQDELTRLAQVRLAEGAPGKRSGSGRSARRGR